MKTINNLLEGLLALILIPIVLIFKLIAVALVFAFVCSPLILIGFIVWVIAR